MRNDWTVFVSCVRMSFFCSMTGCEDTGVGEVRWDYYGLCDY